MMPGETILGFVRSRGEVSTAAVAAHFGIARQDAARLLYRLAELGVVLRFTEAAGWIAAPAWYGMTRRAA